jgi:hypothetical protein
LRRGVGGQVAVIRICRACKASAPWQNRSH